MTPDLIQKEYSQLGYQLGWTFMMTRKARLLDAPVCLVGLNPGGEHLGDAIWSCEDGNAYHTEKWGRYQGEQVYSPLQRQVHHLEDLLGLGQDDYLAAQFIPFRSANWRRLHASDRAVDCGRRLWGWVLSQSPATLFLCLGNEAAVAIADLIGNPEPEQRYPAGWGKATIGRYVGADGRVVVRLPHLSRYTIFGRSNERSTLAITSLKIACRPAA